MRFKNDDFQIRGFWERVNKLPFGKTLFSYMIGFIIPYTGSIKAKFVELDEGYAKVTLKDRRRVRNHLQSIHAIALANLGELTANAALLYAMPQGLRLIPTSLSIQYKKKARGTLTAEARSIIPEANASKTYQITAIIRDPSGDIVAECTVHTLVSQIKS